MWPGTSPAEPEFFCVVIQSTFRQLRNGRFSPNLVMKRNLVSRRWIWKDIVKNFHFRGHLPPKSEMDNRSNRHLTQSRLQIIGCTGMGCVKRYCLFHVVVQGPGSIRGRSTFLHDVRLRSYGSSKLLNFRILAYFPYTTPLKRTFQWPAYRPGVTSQNDSDFSMW